MKGQKSICWLVQIICIVVNIYFFRHEGSTKQTVKQKTHKQILQDLKKTQEKSTKTLIIKIIKIKQFTETDLH